MYMMGVMMMMDVDVYNSAIVRIWARKWGVWMPVRIWRMMGDGQSR